MSDQETLSTQKRRGPEPTGKGWPIGVRLQPELLNAIDDWIAQQPGLPVTRAEAIRQILCEKFGISTPLSVPARLKPTIEQQVERGARLKARYEELGSYAAVAREEGVSAPWVTSLIARYNRHLKRPHKS